MKLLTYVARRLLLSIPVLLGITIITFGIAWQANEGHMERGYLTDKMTPDQRARVVEQYGFDEPFQVQYFSYLARLVKLDLGVSHVTSDLPITEVYQNFFPATIELSLVALIIALFGGIFLGTLSAIHKDAPVDHATRFLALAGVSVPVFWLGLLLKFAFATTFPAELFTQSGPITMGIVLFVAYSAPLLAGLFLAQSVDTRTLTWRKLAIQTAAGGAMIALGFFLQWTFFAVSLLLIVATALVTVAAVKVAKNRGIKHMTWRWHFAAIALFAFGLAFSPFGASAVGAVFDLIPDFPLGSRFSNALIFEGTHPSLTEGFTGLLLIDTVVARDWVAFNDVMLHLVLPGITLGYASLAVIARMMRSSMLEVLSLDFVRTARAKGLPESQVIARHARRNALIPIATVVGLTFGGLLSGAVLTETIFQWPGLGRWSTSAIVSSDTNSIMNFTLLVVIVYLVANLVVDVMYSVLDPRVRLS